MSHASLVLLALGGSLSAAGTPANVPPAGPDTPHRTERVTLPLRRGTWESTAVRFDQSGSAPWIDGNCLSVEVNPSELNGLSVGKADVAYWEIRNINAENLHQITRRLGLAEVEAAVVHHRESTRTQTSVQGQDQGGTKPRVQVVAEGDCIITDKRIPGEWFRSERPSCLPEDRWWEYVRAYPDFFNVPSPQADCVGPLTRLLDPARVGTLDPDGMASTLYQAVYWLAVARVAGQSPPKVLNAVHERLNIDRKPAQLVRGAFLRALDKAGELGCLGAAGAEAMRQGKAPFIRRRVSTGERLVVALIIPRAVCPELDRCFANLEFLPEGLSQTEAGKVGTRQVNWAQQLREAGLLSVSGSKAVERAAGQNR